MTSTIFRYFPREVIKVASVWHAGTDSGPQAYATKADETVTGALVLLSRYQRALMGGDLRKKYLFFVNTEANILESDLVTVGGINYKVANVDLYDYGTIKHKAALLSTV